jgi:hypothetical protein
MIWSNTVYFVVSNIIFGFSISQVYVYIRLVSNIILLTKQLLLGTIETMHSIEDAWAT